MFRVYPSSGLANLRSGKGVYYTVFLAYLPTCAERCAPCAVRRALCAARCVRAVRCSPSVESNLSLHPQEKNCLPSPKWPKWKNGCITNLAPQAVVNDQACRERGSQSILAQ